MPIPRESRKYDIVLLGANGYTGSLTAEHIVQHLPANLRWALAGRSRAKLEALAGKLKSLNPDRLQPDVEVVSFDDRDSLHGLIQNARVCISVVLYWTVGAQVIEACIENQTDYVDTEGDTATTLAWCDKYHEKAVANGTILVHACGMLSAPQDILSLAAVKEMSKKYSLKTREIILAQEELPQELSGGTAEAIGHKMGADPTESRKAETDPWYLSPVRGTAQTSTGTNLFGIRRDAVFGVLAAATFSASQNRAVVHRAWGLLQQQQQQKHGENTGDDVFPAYGAEFQYNEYAKAASVPAGLVNVLGHFLVLKVLSTRVLYNLLRRTGLLLPAGQGPDVEMSKKGVIRLAAQAVAEEMTQTETQQPGNNNNKKNTGPQRRVVAHFKYNGGPYLATAMFLAEGAASLLHYRAGGGGGGGGEDGHVIPAGCLTPALLGDDLFERVQKAGVKIHFSYP